MNREILFKAKTIGEYSEWVYGFPFERENEFYITHKNKKTCPNIWSNELVVKETISQFSGELDKKGNKIFENDFVRNYNNDLLLVGFDKGSFIAYFFYDEEKKVKGKLLLGSFLSNIEVVGNSIDNPELVDEFKTQPVS